MGNFLAKRKKPKTSILDLPPELIVVIFRNLPTEDIHERVKKVCKVFQDIVSENFESIQKVYLDLENHPEHLGILGRFVTNHVACIQKLTLLHPSWKKEAAQIMWKIVKGSHYSLTCLTLGESNFRARTIINSGAVFRTLLKPLSNLEELSLTGHLELENWDTKAVQAFLKRNKKLRVLRICNCPVDVIRCLLKKASKSLTVLEILYIDSSQQAPLKEWSDLDRFRDLTCISASFVTPEFWECLSRLPKLTDILLINCGQETIQTFNTWLNGSNSQANPKTKAEKIGIDLSHDIDFRVSVNDAEATAFWSYFSNVSTIVHMYLDI